MVWDIVRSTPAELGRVRRPSGDASGASKAASDALDDRGGGRRSGVVWFGSCEIVRSLRTIRCSRDYIGNDPRGVGIALPSAGDPTRTASTARPRAGSSSVATCSRRRARCRPEPASVLARRSTGSARSSSTRSTSPAATTTCVLAAADRRLPARAGPTTLLYDERVAVRDLQQGPVARCRRRSCPGTGSPGTGVAAGHDDGVVRASTPISSRSSSSASGATGPLSSTDVEPRAAIDWYWRPTNQVRAILEALAEAGILGLARREGNRRVYDLAERLFPPTLLAERRPQRRAAPPQAAVALPRARPARAARRPGGDLDRDGARRGRRCATARRGRAPDRAPGGAGRRSTVEGVRASGYILAEERPLLDGGRGVGRGRRAGRRRASRSWRRSIPFVWDRDLLRSLFDFDYVWEVYVPAAKRRWGYYVLPLLWGDRLVGRIEPRIDRRTGVMRVIDVWWEDGFDPLTAPGFVDAFVDALTSHARFVGAVADRLATGRAAPRPGRRGRGPGSARRVASEPDGDRLPAAPVARPVHGTHTELVRVATGPGGRQ